MKKLFTTLLLLGAVVGTQAQVVVTDYDADTKTVTINYDKSLGVADEGICNRAIDDYFNPLFPDLHGQQREAAIRDAVSTIVLTGDWDNQDTNKDGVNGQGGKTIKKIVDKFSTQQSRDTLDLSACDKMMSKFVSVRDQIGDVQNADATTICSGFKSQTLNTYFTANYKLPDEVTTTILYKETTVKEVKIDNKPMKKENFDSEADYNNFLAELAAGTTNGTYNYGWAQNPGDQPKPGTVKYYTAGTTIYPTGWSYTLQSDGWYYISNDLNTNQKLTPEFKDTYYYTEEGVDYEVPNVNLNNLVANADGTYTYTQTITHVDTPFAIDYNYNIGGIVFPANDHFTYIPDALFINATGLKKAVLSDYTVAIGNEVFEKSGLEEVNFPSSIVEIGHTAFEQTNIKAANLSANTSMTRIRRETFELCSALETVTFPNSLIEIQPEAFYKAGITDADMSACHGLKMISQFSFGECQNLVTVKVCSHPKTIKGPTHGNGAFNESLAIKTVEVVACDDVTDITQCVCETGAFTFDVTNAQTSVESVERAARLIYPRTKKVNGETVPMPVGQDSEYTSAFDFFVGDYKAGVPCSTHEELLDYWYNVPNSPTGTTQLSKDPSVTIGKQLYAGNGWFEFINTGDGITIEPEEGTFLRTYSRTEDSGPVLLPSTITAYRAIDYASTGSDYVGKKNGEYVNINEYETDAEADYKVYDDMSAEDKVTYKKYPRYSILTVQGQLLLRPLRPLKVADKSLPRTEWTYVESATESYVPEYTGVVLYSTNIAEDAFLVFAPYTEYDYQFPEYRHTGTDRNEEDRLDKGGVVGDRYNEDPELRDDINMLQGSYGTGFDVAPVLPWNWEKNTYYKNNMQYRNFGFNMSVMKWRRLTPGVLRLNRAFAMIPIGRFDNHNETAGQMPDFTLYDHVTPPSPTSTNTILVFGSEFEDETTDGIQTISTNTQGYDKDAWYTLQGVRVDNPTKGVYIHNNKKVVIK